MATGALGQTRADKLLTLLGHGIFALLFVWAVLYYQARVLSYDGAWQLFLMIQEGDFTIAYQRYLIAGLQWLPVLLIKLGAPLKAVMLSYSISWVLYPYLIYLFLIYGLKHVQAGMLLLCALVLSPGVTYFYITAELPPSLYWLVIWMAWQTRPLPYSWEKSQSGQWISFGIAALLVITASYGRIIIGFGIVWLLLFQLLDQPKSARKNGWLLLGIAIAWYSYRWLSIPSGSYTSNILGQFMVSLDPREYLMDESILGHFYRKLAKGLWLGYAVGIGMMVYYGVQRRYLLGLFMLASLLVLSYFAIAVSPRGVMGSDHYLMIWGSMIGWPLLVALWPQRPKALVTGLLALILVVGTFTMHNKRQHFVKRIPYLESLISQARSRNTPKALLRPEEADPTYLWVSWSLGTETLLLSSLDPTQQTVSVFATQADKQYPRALADKTVWMGTHFATNLTHQDLPVQYFRLPTVPYRYLWGEPEATAPIP